MNKKKIEAIFPLTQTQLTYLWHSLGADTDRCLVSVRIQLTGELDSHLLRLSWEEVAQKEPVLRTSVHWKNVKAPLQVVARHIQLPWTEIDWQSNVTTENSIGRFCSDEIRKSVALDKSPMFRIFLIKCHNNLHEMIWICHHMLLDGWSGSLVIRDVLNRYDAHSSGKIPMHSNPAPNYQHYVKWCNSHASAAAELYWKKMLSGIGTPASVLTAPDTLEKQSTEVTTNILEMSEPGTAMLNQQIRRSRLTLNALVQGLWAMLLHTMNGSSDIVFGATVSGRQITLEGADRIIGLLATTIPIRIPIESDQPLVEWLQGVQTRHLASLEHTTVNPSTLHELSGVSGSLFESVVVVENQPHLPVLNHIQVSHSESGIVSNAAVTLIAIPGVKLSFKLIAPEILANGYTAKEALGLLHKLIKNLEENLHFPVLNMIQIATNFSEKTPSNKDMVVNALGGDTRASHSQNELNKCDNDIIASCSTGSIQDRVTRVWRNVLGPRSGAADVSFFDMGGSSLQAIRLIEQLQTEFGADVPITILFRYKTISDLTAFFTSASSEQELAINATKIGENRVATKTRAEEGKTIVTVQLGDQQTPLYIADTTTDTLIYRHLARHLGETQPIFALAARNLRDRPFSELAELLTLEIVEHHPVGPLLLAGSSGGGTLAWHICQKLEAQGRQVSVLVLLDSYGPDFPILLPPMQRFFSVIQYCYEETRDWWNSRNKNAQEKDHSGRINERDTGDSRTKESTQGLYRDTDENSHGKRVNAGRIVNTDTLRRLNSGLALVKTGSLEPGLIAKAINVFSLLVFKFGKFSTAIALPTYIRGVQLLVDTDKHLSSKDFIRTDSRNDIESIRQSYRFMYDGLARISARVVYFRATQRPPGTASDRYSGWERFIGVNTVFHEVSGTHVSLMQEPNIEHLSALLQHEITRASLKKDGST